MLLGNSFRYDVFVSYSHKDQKWVHRYLVPRMLANNIRVCIDFQDFEPGAPSLTEMERAVSQSQKILLILTPDYLTSEWAEFENILGQTLDPAARKRKIIPILLKECTLPLRISALTYLDFTRQESHAHQYERLIGTLIGKVGVGSDPYNVASSHPLPPSPLTNEPVLAQVDNTGFWTHGPLPFTHLSYQVREEEEALSNFVRGKSWDYYMELRTPHQMGVTSLLFRLMQVTRVPGLHFAYIDLSQLCKKNESIWYEDLCQFFETQLGWQIGATRVTTALQFRQYLLVSLQSRPDERVVIILDEVGTPFAWSRAFFGVLRNVFCSRIKDSEAAFARICFILAGKFDFVNLLRGPASPWNIAERLYVGELTEKHVRNMVGLMGLPDDVRTEVAARVFYWTSGHPYLVQSLCNGISQLKLTSQKDVDLVVEETIGQDKNHFPFLLRDVRQIDSVTRRLLLKVMEHERVPFNRLSVPIARLELLGLVRGDSRGHTVLRNRMYYRFLRSCLFATPPIRNWFTHFVSRIRGSPRA